MSNATTLTERQIAVLCDPTITGTEAARRVGVSRQAASYWRIQAGIKARRGRVANANLTTADIDALCDPTIGAAEAARRVGVAVGVAARIRRQRGIKAPLGRPLRAPGEKQEVHPVKRWPLRRRKFMVHDVVAHLVECAAMSPGPLGSAFRALMIGACDEIGGAQ